MPSLTDLPKNPKPPAFVLTHGAGGGIDDRGLTALARGLFDAGHAVLRLELPYRAAGRKSPPKAELSVPGFVQAFEDASKKLGRCVAGGKSYGGRVASMAVADGMEAAGLVFYGYPLHAPGRSGEPRVDHWARIDVPCLFLQGTRDQLCDLKVLEKHLGKIPGGATLEIVEGGDHSLKVSSKRDASVVLAELAPVVAEWAAKSF